MSLSQATHEHTPLSQYLTIARAHSQSFNQSATHVKFHPAHRWSAALSLLDWFPAGFVFGLELEDIYLVRFGVIVPLQFLSVCAIRKVAWNSNLKGRLAREDVIMGGSEEHRGRNGRLALDR